MSGLSISKMATKFAATSSQCWSFFFFWTFDELCIRSLFHLVRLSVGSFTARVWNDWGKMWGANGLETWKNGDWLSHHNHASAHTSFVVREFLTKNNMSTVPHSACSPDLAPCDFYVFPKMKLLLKGQCFVPIEEIQAESQQVLNMLTPADFSEFFQKWQNRWDRCIQAQGDYFEGDGGN